MRVLIAPDKFKGTLSAAKVASAIQRGWAKVRPKDSFEQLPISDGGDGFGELLGAAMGAKTRRIKTFNAAGEPVWAKIYQAGGTVIIESAQSNGLALLPPGKFHPFQLDTAGVAVLLRAAEVFQPKECFVGVGGSATNDGGFGMAKALGYGFLDRAGRQILSWPELSKLEKISLPADPLKLKITLALDVQNPLLGLKGCARIFGPQKGLRKRDLPKTDKALERLAEVVRQTFGENYAAIPGAGAAGGLGFGLLCFAGAAPRSGFEVFCQYSGLAEKVRTADVVITGEGSLDPQSLMGKGVGELAALCRKFKKPCIGIAGKIEGDVSSALSYSAGLLEFTDIDNAKASPAKWIAKASAQVAEKFSGRAGV